MISKIKKPVSILLVFMMIVSLFAIVPITASAKGYSPDVVWGYESTLNQGDTITGAHYFDEDDEEWGQFFTIKNANTNAVIRSRTSGTWTADKNYVITNKERNLSGMILDFVFYVREVVSTYTVTWKNGDTTLKTDTVDKDAIPVYDGETPVKAEDENYTYTFSGWKNGTNTYGKDETLPAVTANVIYTATFAAEDKAVKNVIALINALPAAAEITAADKAQIETARAAYNLLSGDQKALVTNLDKLTAAETALAAAEKLFPQHSITLGGNIGVNFYINSKTADFAHAGSAVVKFTWDGGGEDRTKEVDLTKLTPNADGYYKATCDVVAAQMAHKIHAEVYLNGEKLEQTDDYSVQDYAETVFKNPAAYDDKGKPDELKALAQALLNYGAMAQTVFADSLNEAVNLPTGVVGVTDFSGVTADDIAAAIKGSASDLNTAAAAFDAEFYTSSLIYLSRNTLRLYFTPASKTVGALNGLDFSGNLSEYYYYVDVENIAAAELDNQQTFSVNGTEFTFSALDYAKAVVNSNNMSDTQKDLAKSLYLYNQAANAYFDAAPAPVHTHTPGEAVQENVVPASCTAAGSYDEVVYCSECHEELSRETKTIDMLAHTIVAVAEVPATTEADGVAAHYECSVCHKLFSDVEGNNETTAEELVIPQIVENVVDLRTLQGDYEAKDGDVLSGALKNSYKITIADGATITLRDANITLSSSARYAGITPLGDATIMLEGTNTVKGGYQDYPGIFVPVGKTLTIDGTGSLTASSNGYGCGIGGGRGNIKAGNIVINGGTITANGGEWAAGIGSGPDSTCGNITITGGTITANGGEEAAGIGSGSNSTCGDITIAGTVTQVTATRGEYADASIGAGESGTCGTVTIAPGANVTQN